MTLFSRPSWEIAGRIAALEPGQIHLWRADLDALPCEPSLLDAAEQARYHSSRHPEAAQRFCAARGMLRRLLGAYLQVPPADVPLSIAEGGKPQLAQPHRQLQFNTSHSGAVLLIGLALEHAIGVDVEQRREIPNAAQIAARMFTEVPRDNEDFLRRWTALEARQKCLGRGIFDPRSDAETLFQAAFEIDSQHLGALAWAYPPDTEAQLSCFAWQADAFA